MKDASTFGKIGDVLSDETSLRILDLLSKGPQSVKNISAFMNKPESRISEKISYLRKLGIIDYKWVRIGRKNVKRYSMITKKIEINFSNGQMTLLIKRKESSKQIDLPGFIDFSPPMAGLFIGREEELKELDKNSKIFITGISGIGKTSLAAKYVSELKVPVFWHNLREVDSLDYLLLKMSSFLKEFGRENTSKMIAVGAGKRMIIDYCISEFRKIKSVIVFDDIHLCKDKSIIELIEDISQSEPGLKIILISKNNSIPSRGYFVINLKGLSLEESKLLLKRQGKKHDAHTLSALGGYPLALSLVRKVSEEKLTMETLTSELANEMREELTSSQREALLWASSFRESFTTVDLDNAIGKDIQKELDALVAKGLISQRSKTYYIHEFVRKVASSIPNDSKSIHERLGYYYASEPDPTSTIEAIYQFGEAMDSVNLVKIIKKRVPKLVYSGLSEPLLSVLKPLMNKGQDPLMKGWASLWVAMIEKMAGNFSLAKELFESVIKLGNQIDDELVIRGAMGLGQSLNFLGRKGESVSVLQNALFEERNKLKIKDLEASLLLSLGIAMIDIGKLDKAHQAISEAVDLYKDIGDRRSYFTALYYRGYETYLRGDFDKERIDINLAYSGYFEMNFLIDAASCLLLKSLTLWKQRRYNNAVIALNKAIEIFRDQQDKTSEGELSLSLCCRAMIFASMNKTVKAEKDLKAVEALGRGKEDYATNTAMGIAWGMINSNKKDWTASDKYFDLAEESAKDHPYYLCEAKKWRGWSLLIRGNPNEALKEFEYVKNIAYKSGLRIFIGDIDNLLAISNLIQIQNKILKQGF